MRQEDSNFSLALSTQAPASLLYRAVINNRHTFYCSVLPIRHENSGVHFLLKFPTSPCPAASYNISRDCQQPMQHPFRLQLRKHFQDSLSPASTPPTLAPAMHLCASIARGCRAPLPPHNLFRHAPPADNNGDVKAGERANIATNTLLSACKNDSDSLPRTAQSHTYLLHIQVLLANERIHILEQNNFLCKKHRLDQIPSEYIRGNCIARRSYFTQSFPKFRSA